jgi:hypothetical protein
MLLKIVKKEIIYSILKPFLKGKEYKFLSGMAPKFYKKEEDIVIFFWLNFLDCGEIGCTEIFITFTQIEDIMADVRYPSKAESHFEEYKAGKVFQSTIRDTRNLIPYNLFSSDFETKEQIADFGKQIVNYLENYGFSFAEHYSHLPNVLAEMDRLEKEGKYWHEILAGGPDFLFRGLIISKLCGDPDFECKQNLMNEKFNAPKFIEWLPYYEKLKDRLKTLESVYNIKNN